MAKRKKEPSTPAAGGTARKARPCPHHATPLASPSPRIPSRSSRIRDEDEDARRFKTPGTGSRRRRDEGANGSVRRSVRACARRSPRCACQDTEHPVALEEYEVRGHQSAITPLQRSARSQRGDKSLSKTSAEKGSCRKQRLRTPNIWDIAHIRETPNADKRDKKRENPTGSSQKSAAHGRETPDADKRDKKRDNPTGSSQKSAALKFLSRMKKHKELQTLNEDSQDVPARRKTAHASYKKSETQEPKPSCCEEPTRKRKRGKERKTTSRKQSQPEPKSDCQEIKPMTEPRNIIHKKSGNDPSSVVQPKISDDTPMKTKECNEELSGIKGGVRQQLCASDDWTEEQDLTLRQAYFAARPSPHFWKKVSKMVPGKSAEECFNRVHADLSTPTPIAPRPRTSKIQFSPLGHFTLSDSKFPNILEPLVGRQKTAKQKSLAAQKTVRHLLKKHSLIDQAQEADHFSIFETSPSALQLNIPLEDSPGTPDNHLNSISLHKYSLCSSARKRPLSRLKAKQDEPSPAVLKPVKNVVLHERYINQLSRREVAKKPRKKAAGTETTDPEGPLLGQQAGVVKTAKNALMSEATDFICQFKKLQANSLAHVLENCDDDVENFV